MINKKLINDENVKYCVIKEYNIYSVKLVDSISVWKKALYNDGNNKFFKIDIVNVYYYKSLYASSSPYYDYGFKPKLCGIFKTKEDAENYLSICCFKKMFINFIAISTLIYILFYYSMILVR